MTTWDLFCLVWLSIGYRAANPVPRDVPDHDDPNDSPYTDPVL